MKLPPNHLLYLPHLNKFHSRGSWLDCYQSKLNMADVVLGEKMCLPASQISTLKIVYTSCFNILDQIPPFSWYVYRFNASYFKVRKNGRCNSKNFNYFTRSLDVQYVFAYHNLEFNLQIPIAHISFWLFECSGCLRCVYRQSTVITTLPLSVYYISIVCWGTHYSPGYDYFI